MKLMLQEVEVRYVIPSIRRELANGLSKEKFKQKEIAELLNITPSAVSQYLSKKRGTVKFSKRITDEIKKQLKKSKQKNQLLIKK